MRDDLNLTYKRLILTTVVALSRKPTNLFIGSSRGYIIPKTN